ncbi:hypothetical protein [Jiella sp. M17.18]|uniref:hypothetical protein n=1 Tax=Jiella sp. M17.18 TaxID=3234247 RepID=UPI0034DF01C4
MSVAYDYEKSDDIEKSLIDDLENHCGKVVAHRLMRKSDDLIHIYVVSENCGRRAAWVCKAQKEEPYDWHPGADVWIAKHMPDWSMPYMFEMPEDLLDRLTKTDDAYAAEWRALCRQRIEAARPLPVLAPKPGDTLTIVNSFTGFGLEKGIPRLLCRKVEGSDVTVVRVDKDGLPEGEERVVPADMLRPLTGLRDDWLIDRLEAYMKDTKKIIEQAASVPGGIDPERTFDFSDVYSPIYGEGRLLLPDGSEWFHDPFYGKVDAKTLQIHRRYLDAGLVMVPLVAQNGVTRVAFIVGRGPDDTVVALRHGEVDELTEQVRRALEVSLGQDLVGSKAAPQFTEEVIEDDEFRPAPMLH